MPLLYDGVLCTILLTICVVIRQVGERCVRADPPTRVAQLRD
jgi:hypothetical protein